MKEDGLSFEDFLATAYEEEAVFPWQVLDMGFSSQYLYREMKKAAQLQYTKPCFSGCKRCGVCDTMEDEYVSVET